MSRSNMAADVRRPCYSIRASSPFPMVTKHGIYNVDDTGTEFITKNRTKSHLKAILTPILTFQPIKGQELNSINGLAVHSYFL